MTRDLRRAGIERILAAETALLGQEPEPAALITGMPKKGQIFSYRDYERFLKPGQLIAGIRADGSAQIATWADYKILLILGSSSSGKTTTIVEKCVCGARSGGRLVICDPHAFKPDSLTRRITSLQFALMPGTTMAMEHKDIMTNVRAVHDELERRRRGGDMRTPIFLVIEELNRLMRDKAIADELSSFIEEMGQEARGYNIFVILCAQRATGLANIRNSVIAFICHKVSPMESSKIIPARYAKMTGELGVGQTFVIDGDGNAYPLQQVLIEERDVRALAQRSQMLQSRQTGPVRPPLATQHSQTFYTRQTEPVRPAPPAQQPAAQTRAQLPGNQRHMPHRTHLTPSVPLPSSGTPRSPGSATWGEPPRASRPVAPQPPAPQARPRSDTEGLAPRTAPGSDPFAVLAALRDQQRPKRS